MIYFDSKYLSKKFNVNSAKWKRWAREFLPVDPLGGYQSGYARQFNCKDAFRVYLGGHLVSVLRFTIPEARQILADLEVWLKKQGFYAMTQECQPGASVADHIYIYNLVNNKFAYAVRTIIERQSDTANIHSERYALSIIGAASDLFAEAEIPHARVIHIKALHGLFLSAITQEK
jgi:hypothetical protein